MYEYSLAWSVFLERRHIIGLMDIWRSTKCGQKLFVFFFSQRLFALHLCGQSDVDDEKTQSELKVNV